jgi:hypothetical protein
VGGVEEGTVRDECGERLRFIVGGLCDGDGLGGC